MREIGLIGTAALVFVGGTLSILAGAPTIWSPLPLINVIFGFMVAATPLNGADVPLRTLWLSAVAALPITLAFIAWSKEPILRGAIPRRSIVLLAVVIAASLLFFVAGWSHGVQWQGFRHTAALAAINATFGLVPVAALLKHRSSLAPGSSLVFHGALFLWLTWFAFPWLGELL
jgi:glucan phosphoethanolaminetransferase (alkaline phosphatase superfamily)